MTFLTEWVINIILFLLMMIVVDMLLPNSQFKKYTKIVTSLLLMTIILTPLFQLFTKDYDEILTAISPTSHEYHAEVENKIDFKKNEIQASQSAYILEQMAVQMKTEVEEELIDQFGLQINNIDIQLSGKTLEKEEDIEQVNVYLTEADEQRVVAPVKIVEMKIETKREKTNHNDTEEKIAQLLASNWNLSDQVIVVHIEGGE